MDNIENQDYENDFELNDMLYARHAEIKNLEDLGKQRGTTIPALFSTMYKFIQNPSSVSVETYKRMIDTDDTVGSGVDFLCTCLAARLGKYTHPNKDLAKWINDRLKDIEGGWFNTIKEILSASWAGFSVSEKVWANDEKKGFILKKIVTLPPTTVLFETERTGELTADGILQYQRNWNPMSLSSGIGYFGGLIGAGSGFLPTGDARPDPFSKYGDLAFPMRVNNSWNYLSIRIPKQKCIHYSFDAQGKFGNPYGRSLLRRCYKYYVLKDSVLQMLAVALDRKGTPLTVVYADPHATMLDPNKKEGTGNQRGKPVGIRADEAARQAFERVHNDSVMILPGKKGQIYDLDFIAQNANADTFIQTLDFCNKSTMRALLIPSLIFGNGDGSGSYALGQEHSKTFIKIMDGMLQGLECVLLEHVIRELIAYNWPKELWEDAGLGEFSKTEFSDEDLEKMSRIWTDAITNGVIDTNDLQDLNRMRGTLGFSERTAPVQSTRMGDVPMSDNEMPLGNEDIQDTALNGAQVSSLVEILNNVSNGLLPKDSAIAIISAAFPNFSNEKIMSMLSSIQAKETQNGDNGGDFGSNSQGRNGSGAEGAFDPADN